MDRRWSIGNEAPHFLTMMVRAARAVDLLAKSSGAGCLCHEANEG